MTDVKIPCHHTPEDSAIVHALKVYEDYTERPRMPCNGRTDMRSRYRRRRRLRAHLRELTTGSTADEFTASATLF